jgi:citrate lyase subunit beta / citryl-CoA lyase
VACGGCRDDRGHPGTVIGVIVPKAEDPGQLEALSLRVPSGEGVIPLIETAAGVMRAPAVCAVTGVVRPLVGSLDLAAQLGVDHQVNDALRQASSPLVLAAAASGCAAPLDGVTTSLTDDSQLRADLDHAVTLGFSGKLCIHPRQVAMANQRLSPSNADIRWAARPSQQHKQISHRIQRPHDRSTGRAPGPDHPQPRIPSERRPTTLPAHH